MSDIHAKNIFKDIESCNDALHSLKKSLGIYLVQKAEEASSNSEEETFDAMPVARRLIELLAIEAQQLKSFIAHSTNRDSSEVSCNSKTGRDGALEEGKHLKRKHSEAKAKEDNRIDLTGDSALLLNAKKDLGAQEEKENDKVRLFEVMDFNDLILSDDLLHCLIPNGHHGFNYVNFYARSAKHPFLALKKGLEVGCISPPNVGFVYRDTIASIKSAGNTTFAVCSLFAINAARYQHKLKILFEGLDSHSVIVESKAIVISTGKVKQIIFNGFSKLTEFRITVEYKDFNGGVAIENVMFARFDGGVAIDKIMLVHES